MAGVFQLGGGGSWMIWVGGHNYPTASPIVRPWASGQGFSAYLAAMGDLLLCSLLDVSTFSACF